MSSYGTKSATGPWNLILRLQREPRCPGCCEWLQPIATIIAGGWAWCHLCESMGLPFEKHLAFAMTTDAVLEHSTIVSGVKFYSPRSTMGQPKNALAFYETGLLDLTEKAHFELANRDRDSKQNVPPGVS